MYVSFCFCFLYAVLFTTKKINKLVAAHAFTARREVSQEEWHGECFDGIDNGVQAESERGGGVNHSDDLRWMDLLSSFSRCRCSTQSGGLSCRRSRHAKFSFILEH